MGDRDESKKILGVINPMYLQQSERESMALFIDCLDPNGSLECPINLNYEIVDEHERNVPSHTRQ
jgi:hypothetical protein